jgi:hypothetical protein
MDADQQDNDEASWTVVHNKKLNDDMPYRSPILNKVTYTNRGVNLVPYDGKLTYNNTRAPTISRSNLPVVIPKPVTMPRRIILDTPFSNRSTVSYGLIVYAKNSKRWILTQRKHSVEFLLFIKGLYRLTHLPLLLSSITAGEKYIIKRCIDSNSSIFTDIYLNELGLPSEDLVYASIRLTEVRPIISNLLNKLSINNSLAWTWPKGRIHISYERETPFSCAMREFIEEVEIKLPDPLMITDNYLSETVKTITGRQIEARYWIYVIEDEITIPAPLNHSEVSARIWVNTETCRKLIQHTDLFRQVVEIVSKVH